MFRSPTRSRSDLLWALLLATAATVGCTAEADEEARVPSDPRLSANPAPAGLSFATTRPAIFRLEPSDVTLTGDVVQLRIGLEPSVSDPLYVGRVLPGKAIELRLSFPNTSQTLHYELSDETGASQHGETAP